LSNLSSLKYLRHVSKHQQYGATRELRIFASFSRAICRAGASFLTLSLKTNGRCSGDVRTGAVLRQLDNNTYGRVYVEWPEASDAATYGGSGQRRMGSMAVYMYVGAGRAMVGKHRRRLL
jgi:hypothetical protein